ncbi:ATP-dependent DNA helicase [Ramaria rubella]|nr:ATP-dependent DNA helicase [Ramaria rubella]
MNQARQILRDVFKFQEFRVAQKERLLENHNALVLLPTGGGKSLCFQIPALCLEGLTLVISPLISLMKDQVEALNKRGVRAASLDSTLTAQESSIVKSSVLCGDLKILYVAPERLNNEGFLHMMRRIKISLLAVDESHCISQWGASFRPEYLKIARFAVELSVERVLCLTATATPEVEKDICTSFHIDIKEGVFKSPVYRPNLSFQVTTAKTLKDKMEKLVPFLRGRKGPSIVYVTLQKQAEDVATILKTKGIDAWVYHAGLKAEQRDAVQNAFMASRDGIVIATIAFGMGIDKGVVHLYLPKTLENFSQEVGRAGRDGLPSDCLMFLAAEDIPVLEGFARGDTCAKSSLELWLGEIAMKAPASDGSLDFNHYQQAKLYDIRSNTLGLLYAQLELDFNYIRAVTPFYAVYEIRERDSGCWKHVLSDNSDEAKIIRRYWRSSGKYHRIDVVDAAIASKTHREHLAKTISKWELEGLIETKASQVRHRYLVVGNLPKTHAEIGDIAEKIFQRMVSREEEAVEKLRKVIEFGSAAKCLARTLASHFGDEDAITGGSCTKCTFCTTGAPTPFDAEIKTAADPGQIKAILSVCHERDDPRLLARFAFGVTSPRLMDLKLTKHPLFGTMGNVDYRVLLEVFEEECAAAGYQLAGSEPETRKRAVAMQSQSVSKRVKR